MALAATAQAHLTEMPQKDTYRLIVFDSAGTAILLEPHGREYRLPTIEIPKFSRPAHEATCLLRNSWGMCSVFLFAGVLEEIPNASYFAVLESKDGFRSCPRGMEWFTIHHVLSNLLLGQERRVVQSSYRKAVRQIPADSKQPFCRVGWLADLEDWVRKTLDPSGVQLKGFEQLNGCETFSLIRFATTQRPVWFKAVGGPNLHEYGISLALARLLPDFVPAILATKPEWHGWLMADAGESALNETEDSSAWQAAVTALADLQIDSLAKTDDLLKAGCRDSRIATLLDLVDPFLDTLADLMNQQTKVPPAILSRQELTGLGATLKDALSCLSALPIPDALGHSDFNPGNIIVGPKGSVFIDWAEAHVSHPFLTCEYLISHLRKDFPSLVRFEGAIKSSYSKRWHAISSPEHVSEAFLFSPLVAVFAYAAAGNVWRDTERLKVPQVPGYLRSLTRRMKQEADLIQRRRVECPN
jgi:hypothetical protein